MKFTEIAFTVYPTKDLAGSRAFYEGVLGLVPEMVFLNEDGVNGWVEYEFGPHVLAIGQMEGLNPCADGPSCGLECDDFEETIAGLREAGVKFSKEPFETPFCHMAVVADPAGNALILHKRKEGNA